MDENTLLLEKWSDIDVESATKEQVKEEILRLESLRDLYMNAEQATKIFLNSIYGACGSPWFSYFNIDIAEAVTLQGQDLIKYSEKILNRYFLEYWHNDEKLHKKLGIAKAFKVEQEVVVYCDTDSVHKDTIIETDQGSMTIEDMYNISKKIEEQNLTASGKEWIKSSLSVLNYKNSQSAEKLGSLIYSPVTKVIRHKVSKPKWKLKTKSGKEIIVTNDHSLIVYREGQTVEIKPIEIKKGEKVICVRINK
jgi:DNA polymerase elongation subunit (family B)